MPRSNDVAERRTAPLRILVPAVLAALTMASVAAAQIPDKFTNLQVLPKEISKGDLVTTMKSYTRALGVRCEHCHSYRAGVDPAAASFSDFDFASDAREAKVKAREMVKMVRAINTDYIDKLAGGASLQVRCITCHRGVALPESIDERMERIAADEGLAAAVTDYRELREEYLESGSYDFSERPLNSLGERLTAGGKVDVAKGFLQLNVELHADSARAHQLLGEAFLAGGDRDAARAAFAKSLELDPDNPPLRKKLEELKPADSKPADSKPDN